MVFSHTVRCVLYGLLCVDSVFEHCVLSVSFGLCVVYFAGVVIGQDSRGQQSLRIGA
jgi:hypothetical protein